MKPGKEEKPVGSYRSQQWVRKGLRGKKESWLVESNQSVKDTLGGHFIDDINVITHRQYGHYWLEHVICLIMVTEAQSGPNFGLQGIDVKLKRKWMVQPETPVNQWNPPA